MFVRSALCLLSAAPLLAQVAPKPADKPATEAPNTLSVFEVTSDKDTGYTASTALSGTRTSKKLENLPNSISVMTILARPDSGQLFNKRAVTLPRPAHHPRAQSRRREYRRLPVL